MSKSIPLSVPSLRGNEWKYVKECLDTEWVSSGGAYVGRFEEAISRYTGASHAIACVNGTAALHIALLLAGVKPGDEVLVPTVTFIAPVNAVRYAGATPVFFDCDEFYNIDVSLVAKFLQAEVRTNGGSTINRRTGRRIAAIVPVHVFGNAVRLEELVPHCREGGIAIVEDATESLGTRYATGTYAGRHAGTVGRIGCLSFNGNKIITTGGGGMILMEDGDLALRARYLTTQAKDDHVRYVHNEVGYNFRLTNVQAAMGVAQLERLNEHLRIKEANYRRYEEGIAGIPGLSLAGVPPYARNNRWMYALRLDRNRFWTDRDGLMSHLAARGIETRPVWMLNHLQRPYRDCQYVGTDNAAKSLESTLNIPCSVNLTEDDVRYVLQGLRND